jgi:VanZ family protein
MSIQLDRQFTLQWVLLQTALIACLLGALRFISLDTQNSIGRFACTLVAICCFFGILMGSIERTCQGTITAVLMAALILICGMSLGLAWIVISGSFEEVVHLVR